MAVVEHVFAWLPHRCDDGRWVWLMKAERLTLDEFDVPHSSVGETWVHWNRIRPANER